MIACHNVYDAKELMAPKRRLAIKVSVPLPADPGIAVRLEKISKRGNPVDIHDFSFDETTKSLWFTVSSEFPKDFEKVFSVIRHPVIIANTFVDFCWTVSNGTTPESIAEISAELPKEIEGSTVELGDLTQVLPGKFCDEVLDSLGAMNWNDLDGIMDQAILYGPVILN